MNGILNINKPVGSTSFDIVSTVRKLIGERRVGHAGTLDPIASGVLPVCFGQGTRVIEFLQEASKVYWAHIELGTATDTYDASGKIIKQADYSSISKEQLEQALESFRGAILQTPPMFSAVKHNGQRLYNLARQGISVERKSRPATIHGLEITDFKPPFLTLEVECSRGTYIRSLAHDLGEMLGCGAHLFELVRLSYGPFDIGDAISLTQLEDAAINNLWQHYVYPMDSVLRHWPTTVVNEEQERLIINGSGIDVADSPVEVIDDNRCLAYNKEGDLLAILILNAGNGHWQPQKVFV
ncbi:tRNA pseudouridine(55) synthase TruB [Chloroflexota bacterium]